jgi:hypothetical protein
MMLLELDTVSPPLSPATTHTTTYQTPVHTIPPLTLQSSPPTFESPEKFIDIDPTELRKHYVAAMMSLKAEKQQRIPPLLPFLPSIFPLFPAVYPLMHFQVRILKWLQEA